MAAAGRIGTFAEFEEIWGARYLALIGVWRRCWEHFGIFLRKA